ncbi:hypothetical protein MJO28_017530 [Puccinia striiformis f. sp. tritici]|nr:hypothetical protein MJO28_017530 [Puccinia striiformis f. sp. tritici]
MFFRYTVLLAFEEHELSTPSTFQHHQPDQNFLQNALFRLLPCALSDLPAPHGEKKLFTCPHYGYCTNLELITIPASYDIGPAFAPQPSITYTNFLTCKQSKLPIGPPKNSCCDKAIPGVEDRASNDPVNISYNDYTNKYKCHEVPYTN